MARRNRGMIPWRSLTKGATTPAAKSTAKNVVYPAARAVTPRWIQTASNAGCDFPKWKGRRSIPVTKRRSTRVFRDRLDGDSRRCWCVREKCGSKMVGWVGFEPTTNALKGHCSTN